MVESTDEIAGNRLTLLPDGRGRLDALIALIDGAEHSLRLLYYIYAADESGRRVRDALVRALGRGVTVALIVDGFGTAAADDFFAPLEAGGADVCRFIPRFGRRYLLRNHQKLAVADEGRAIIGGFNIEDGYFIDDAEGWRDLGLRIEGPTAARLAGYFDALATWTRSPSAPIRALRRALGQWSDQEGPVRWLMGGPTRRLNPWALAVKTDLRRAIDVHLVAAYFAPNPAMLRRIEGVARRRGQARVLTAARSDNDATIAAARHCYGRLLRRAVRVYEYQPAKLHTKLLVIDDVVHIGSANFDMRSLYLNLEVMLRVEDRAFADRCRAYVDGELAASRRITRAVHRARAGIVNRIVWALCYFIVAVVDYNISSRLNIGQASQRGQTPD
jgi:cardiolipin synthase